MWNLILTALGVFSLAAVIYVTARVHRFSPIKRIAQKHKALAWLAALVPVAAVGLSR